MMHKDPTTGQMVDTDVKGPLDYLSRMDDLLINLSGLVAAGNTIQSKLLTALPTITQQTPASLDQQELRQLMESGAFYPYDTWPANTTQSMAVAVTNQEIAIQGDSIACWTDGAISGIGVRLNRPDAPLVYFNQLNPIRGIPFWKLYLTYSSQVGNSMRLFIGRGGIYMNIPGGSSSAAAGASYQTIYSVSTTHFTGVIAQNAVEQENITNLSTNKIRIANIGILSQQPLDYRLIFYGSSTFGNATIDLDTYLSEQELNLVSNGFQVAGTGWYYMTLNHLAIEYLDADATQTLHVALQDLSATSKLANPGGGAVLIRLTYEQAT